MKTTVIITGVSAIDRRMKLLPLKVQKKVLRPAMRDGLKLVAAEVRMQAPVETGRTKGAVQVRALRQRRRDSVSLEVRISGKIPGLIKQGQSEPVFYPAVVEYGRKDMPPNPFMRRSYEAKGEAARQLAIQRIREGVEREAGF